MAVIINFTLISKIKYKYCEIKMSFIFIIIQSNKGSSFRYSTNHWNLCVINNSKIMYVIELYIWHYCHDSSVGHRSLSLKFSTHFLAPWSAQYTVRLHCIVNNIRKHLCKKSMIGSWFIQGTVISFYKTPSHIRPVQNHPPFHLLNLSLSHVLNG